MKTSYTIVVFLVIACVIAIEARRLEDELDRKDLEILREWLLKKRFENVVKRSCVALGESGCEGNHAKCCRKGDPYTGTMRKCVNEGNFSSPDYVCRE